MRPSHLAAALLPAALLFCQPAFSQNANPRAGGSAGGGSGITLPGPDGRDVLEVNKEAPRQVRAGEEFEYRIVVRNVSDSPVNGVVVVEEHNGLEIRNTQGGQQGQSQQGQRRQGQNNQGQNNQGQNNQGQQGQQQVQRDGNKLRYDIGELQAGESKAMTVTAVANEPGQAQSCLSVEYNPTLCTTFEVVQPDFRLTSRLKFARDVEAEAEVDGVYRCDRLILEVAATSTGDVATKPARVTVDLPKGLTAAEGARNQGGNPQGQGGRNQVQFDLGPLEPNRTVRREIPVKLDPQQAGDQIQLTATATAGDLKAQVQLPGVKVLDPQLNVNVEAPQEAYIDRPVRVKVTVENPSQDPVLNARARVVAAADVARLRAEGIDMAADGMIDFGTLRGGEKREFAVVMEATTPAETQVVVKADGYCVETVQKQAAVSLKGVPALLIEVVDKKDPVPVGETTVYEIAVKNQGTDRDTNVRLAATLPEGVEFVNGRGETKVNANGRQLSFGEIEAIGPGDVVSWTVEVKANQAAKARFKVELNSNATKDRPITEEEPTTLY